MSYKNMNPQFPWEEYPEHKYGHKHKHMHMQYPYYPWADLAEAFVIPQELNELYPLKEALMKGTVFPELWKPYPYPK